MKIKLILICSIWVKVLLAQGIEVEWEKDFEIFEGGCSTHLATQTYDNGYLLMNGLRATSDSTYDYWIIKTDDLGNVEWEKTYGGSEHESPCCAVTNLDGTHLVGGNTYSDDGDIENNNGSSDIWILKLDQNGEILWQKNYGETNQDFLSYITKTTDGGYILGGGSVGNNNGGRDVWLIKIDSEGNTEWSKKYGYVQFDDTVKIQQTSDGGYILSAITSSNYQYDFWILKLDSLGETQWSKILGGSESDNITDNQQLPGGGFIVAGYTRSNNGDIPLNFGESDIILAKFNTIGEVQWIKNYGGSGDDKFPSIQITTNGTILMTAYSLSDDFDLDNHTEGDTWNLELDGEGNILWSQKMNGYITTSLEHTLDDGYVLLSRSYNDNSKYTLTKFNPYEGILDLDDEINVENFNVIVYPNPTQKHVTINSLNNSNILEVKFYDVNGKYLGKHSCNSTIVNLDIDSLSSGVYYIEISTSKEKQTKKLIVK